jgi:basic amino acid/polyamine antiporter, APA family
MDVGHSQAAAPGSVSASGTPRPTLGVREAVALTIGIVVGAGIFRTPSLVAGASASEAAMMLAWAAGGVLCLIGALCYAELASTYPQAGGDYVFLRRAFGKRFAFLYGWARLSVTQTGSIALIAYVFGDYASQIFSLGPMSSALYAGAIVVIISGVHWIGVRFGAGVQVWLTILEIIGLLAVIVAGLLFAPEAAAAAAPSTTTAYGLIMVFVLLTFGGWNEAVFISAELKDAPRRMAPVLAVSLAIIAALYLLVNFAYLRALGLAGMAASEAVAADVMRAAAGDAGAAAISLIIAVAAVTSVNATVFTGARTAFALGRDYPSLAFLGRWNDASGTPRNALLLQGVAALALVVAGAFTRDGFQTAVDFTAPVFWFFFLMAGVSLFVLRRREPDIARPFKVPLYPVLPIIFCLTNAYLLYSSLAYTGKGALVGVGIVAVGGFLLLLLERNTEKIP